MSRMQIALKGADRIDPFACPVCKDPGGFVRVAVAGTYKADIARAQRHAECLWRCNTDDKTTRPEDMPPLMVPQAGTLPAIVYMTYWHNKQVLLAADSVVCDQRRAQLLRESLVPVGDSVRSRCKRAASHAALNRMHSTLGKRRRLDALVLEEARTLVDALEEEEEPDDLLPGTVADLYMILVVKDAMATHLWLHTDLGTAVAFALKSAVVPTWCVTLIHTSGTSPPAVLATVDPSMSGPAAASHIMRCLRSDRTNGSTISQEQAAFLAEQVRAHDITVAVDQMDTTTTTPSSS